MLLAGLPDLLRAIVLEAAARADVCVVAAAPSLEALLPDAPIPPLAGDPHVVISVLTAFDTASDTADASRALPAAARQLLGLHPNVTLLGISSASGVAQLWQLRPRALLLGDLSADSLLTALHARDSLLPD